MFIREINYNYDEFFFKGLIIMMILLRKYEI